ncbi:MAG: phosphoribosylanthranilate isomerase [Desulfatiglandales bacterium]|nr:phosphoribosylanthranilate isomerase [Desulfatiglandales bacterium]
MNSYLPGIGGNVTKEYAPQVKICGLTRVEEALACLEMGARAIGCVFYHQSPRYVTEEQARSIIRALPSWVATVGVFVNEGFTEIMRKFETCGLKAVQLHGQEPPLLVEKLHQEGVQVIKSIFVNSTPSINSVAIYPAYAFLVESAGGALPGGNAMAWNWEVAAEFSKKYRFILAGGLNTENVSEAIKAACPDAVDVSSGVEANPGRKDLDKVKDFLAAVSKSDCSRKPRRVFNEKNGLHL